MKNFVKDAIAGAAAGAVGTTVLNAVTYLDMVLRGRPASQVPAKVAGHTADAVGADLGEGEQRSNRTEGLGALSGISTGVAMGALYGIAARKVHDTTLAGGVVAGAAAMAGANLPIVASGASDPRTWAPEDWASDVIPHLAYGLATATAFRPLRGGLR